MSISDEPSQKLMPTQQYQRRIIPEQRADLGASAQSTSTALPIPQAAYRSPRQGRHPGDGVAARTPTQSNPTLAMQQYPQYAAIPPPLSPGSNLPKRRRVAVPLVITLVLLTVVIAWGSLFGPRLLDTTNGEGVIHRVPMVSGPFMQLPLNSAQINSLRHLVSYMQYKQLASLYVARMNLDEELGQLIMVEYAEEDYSSELDMMVNQLHAGGVIMYEFQMKTFSQTKHDIAEMQRRAQIPLLISTDEEGGFVHRLLNIYPPRPSASDIAATGDPNVAIQQANRVAHELLALGINENLAPDLDVNLVNGYDVAGRSFGDTPESVIKFAGPYMRTLQGDGVIACVKHYPGLGDAIPDAHKTLPVVNRTREQIYAVELAPFKHFIQSPDRLEQPGMIMPTDVLMPAIDPVYPAELSHIFMTDILRKEFGYDGVVLTDALYMTGITEKWSMPEAAVLALNAGNDMLLGPTDSAQMMDMLNGLKAAVQDRQLSKARIDEAATRIIALKMEYHLMPAVPPQ